MSIEKEEIKIHDVETTDWNGKRYDARALENWAEQFPEEIVSLESLRGCVGEEHLCWNDEQGEKLGPSQILKDWEAAKRNPAWAKHTYGVEHANLNNPIWIIKSGNAIEVVNGVHRLTRALIENKEEIKVRILPSLPDFGLVEKSDKI